MRRNRIVGSAFAAALLSAAASSFAQSPASAPTAKVSASPASQNDSTAKARERFSEGVQLAKNNEWQKAYDAFLEAWKLKEHPQIALNLGGAEMKIGKHRDASEHLRYCIDTNPPEHPDTELARKWLEEAKKNVVTLKIMVEGGEAEVRIDGHSVGTSPLPPEVYIDPGKHTVEARSGARHVEVTNTYHAGWTLKLNLVPREPPAPKPISAPSALAGATAPNQGEPAGPRKEVVVGLGVGAGVALLAGGIFAGVSAANGGEADGLRSSLAPGECSHEATIGRCGSLISTVNAQNAFATASMWSFIGAGVLGAATLGYWYLAPGKANTAAQTVRAGAIVAGSGGKVVLEGSW